MNLSKGGTHRKPTQQKIYQQVIHKLSTVDKPNLKGEKQWLNYHKLKTNLEQ